MSLIQWEMSCYFFFNLNSAWRELFLYLLWICYGRSSCGEADVASKSQTINAKRLKHQGKQPSESLAAIPVINSLVFIFRSMGLFFQEVGIALLGEQNEKCEFDIESIA